MQWAENHPLASFFHLWDFLPVHYSFRLHSDARWRLLSSDTWQSSIPTRERADPENANESPWAAYDPPRVRRDTRHCARFFYKLYTNRAFEAARGYLDARRQHKGPFYAATRTGPPCNWTPHCAEISFRDLDLVHDAIKVHRFCINSYLSFGYLIDWLWNRFIYRSTSNRLLSAKVYIYTCLTLNCHVIMIRILSRLDSTNRDQ